MISSVASITAEQIDQANASGRTPVVFIHVIDNGWREVADKALAFVKRFVPVQAVRRD